MREVKLLEKKNEQIRQENYDILDKNEALQKELVLEKTKSSETQNDYERMK